MNVLTIDPGSEKSAYLVWNGEKILERGILFNQQILALHFDFDINIIAIEFVASYGMAVGKEVFETVWWIGRFWQNFLLTGVELQRIYRREIKIYLCNSMKAKDSNIRQALIDRFEPNLQGKERPKGILKGVSKDEWSALALATYCFDKNHQKT